MVFMLLLFQVRFLIISLSNICFVLHVGHPEFEKALRIQMNGLEYLPVVITSMWSTALITQNDVLAGGMGLTYLSGRILYGITYPDKRRAGFLTLFFSMLGLLGITTFYSVDGLVKKYSNNLK